MQIRINKLISESGLGSRREAEAYVTEGRIYINGKRASLSDKVCEKDTVLLDDVELPVAELIQELSAAEAYRKAIEKPSHKNTKQKAERTYISPKSASLRSKSKNNPENKRRHKYKERLETENRESPYAELNRKIRKQKK